MPGAAVWEAPDRTATSCGKVPVPCIGTICTSIVRAWWSGRGPRGERLRGHPAVQQDHGRSKGAGPRRAPVSRYHGCTTDVGLAGAGGRAIGVEVRGWRLAPVPGRCWRRHCERAGDQFVVCSRVGLTGHDKSIGFLGLTPMGGLAVPTPPGPSSRRQHEPEDALVAGVRHHGPAAAERHLAG
jgi:hypothetical protein